MKRFISLAPHLQSPSGHQFIYLQKIGECVQQAGWEHHVLACNTCPKAPLPETWAPFFHAKNNDRFSIFQTFRLCIDFIHAFWKDRKEKRLFFLESFNTSDLAAFTLASFLFTHKQDALWILFRYGTPLLPYKGKLHAFFMKLLRRKLRKRLTLLTDSTLVQRDFSTQLRLPLYVVPIPHTDDIPQETRPFNKTVFCWWPGEPRLSKGWHEMQRLLTTNDPNTSRFTLLLSRKAICPDSTHIKFQALPDPLSREEYAHFLTQSDVILLPYDPAIYGMSTSGIFVEAITAGKMPLVKEGSWLAEELKKHSLTELIVDWKNPTFFSHAFSLLQQSALQEKLKAMRDHYHAFHSKNNFLQTVRDLL